MSGIETVALHGLPFGEAPDGRLISVENVVSGLACGMICPQCRQRLVAKKGPVVRHHFAHEADFACSGAVETLIHKLAKQIIADAKGVMLPALVAQHGSLTRAISPSRWFEFAEVELEVWRDGVRPDVIGRREGRELAVEILVTHACGPDKIAFIQSRQMATIEIDLSGYREQLHTGNMEATVLRDAPRHWLFNAKLGPVEAQLRALEAERLRREAETERQRQKAEAARMQALAEAAARQHQEFAARIAEGRERRQRELDAKSDAEKAQAEKWQREAEARNVILRERQVAQEAAFAARRVAELAQFKNDIHSHAIAMLGEEAATQWLNKRPVSGDPPVNALTDLDFSASLYWEALRDECSRRDADEAARKTAINNLMRGAIMHFHSEDRAQLWARGRNPKLGGKRPIEICSEPDGIARCLEVLR